MHFRVQNYIRSVDSLVRTAGEIKEEEIKSHVAKYICVKISGLLEVYFKSQIGDYVDATSSQPTAAFVKHRFKTFTNIDSEKIAKLLEVFSAEWADLYRSKMTEDLISSLNSIISNRNNIAHGNSDSITFNSIQTHYENVKKILNILDSIIRR